MHRVRRLGKQEGAPYVFRMRLLEGPWLVEDGQSQHQELLRSRLYSCRFTITKENYRIAKHSLFLWHLVTGPPIVLHRIETSFPLAKELGLPYPKPIGVGLIDGVEYAKG